MGPEPAYEIDFLPVGNGERSGDAIAGRIGNLEGPRHEQTVFMVDGGFADDGEALIDHVVRYYRTSTVDFVINTHPDQNHLKGLVPVVETLGVGELWMHDPWTRTNRTPEGLDAAAALRDAARARSIPIREPFAGLTSHDGTVRILGPSEAFYVQQLAEFPTSTTQAVMAALRRGPGGVLAKVRETLTEEELQGGITSARNNTSVITLIDSGDSRLLLTGDAGIPALHDALDRINGTGLTPGGFDLIQIPHHGSRRNVDSEVLNRLLGGVAQQPRGWAIASSAWGAPKHPRQRVTNAFRRRGYPVAATNGKAIWYSRGAPPRAGWRPAEVLPFYKEITDEGD